MDQKNNLQRLVFQYSIGKILSLIEHAIIFGIASFLGAKLLIIVVNRIFFSTIDPYVEFWFSSMTGFIVALAMIVTSWKYPQQSIIAWKFYRLSEKRIVRYKGWKASRNRKEIMENLEKIVKSRKLISELQTKNDELESETIRLGYNY